MSLINWILKHAPDSPGAIANVLAKTFRDYRSKYQDASLDDLLLLTVKSRAEHHKKRYHDTWPEQEQKALVLDAGHNLTRLIFLIIQLEHPEILKSRTLYIATINASVDAVDKYAPQ